MRTCLSWRKRFRGLPRRRYRTRAQFKRRNHRIALRAPGAGNYHNTAVAMDAGGALLGNIARCIFPTTHFTMKNFISRRETWAFRFRYAIRAHRRAGVLGPWYPEGRASRAWAGRTFFLSDGDRLASVGEAEFRRRAAGRMADHSTFTRHREWRFCSCGNRVGFEGPPESGLEFWGIRSFVIRSARFSPSFRGQGRNSCCGVHPKPSKRCAATAVLAGIGALMQAPF